MNSNLHFSKERDKCVTITNNSNQKGLPTIRIMSKLVTNDVISSQTAETWYQWRKYMLIGRVEIFLKNTGNTWVLFPHAHKLHIKWTSNCIYYQYCCNWQNDWVCQNISQLNTKPAREKKNNTHIYIYILKNMSATNAKQDLSEYKYGKWQKVFYCHTEVANWQYPVCCFYNGNKVKGERMMSG